MDECMYVLVCIYKLYGCIHLDMHIGSNTGGSCLSCTAVKADSHSAQIFCII